MPINSDFKRHFLRVFRKEQKYVKTFYLFFKQKGHMVTLVTVTISDMNFIQNP